MNASRSLAVRAAGTITAERAKSEVTEGELAEIRREVVYRHIAWLTALRHAMRQRRPWPDHSSLCRIRQRLDVEVHQAVFTMVLKVLAEHGLLQGKTVGIDATTLEANAALRSIVRRDDGTAYDEFLEKLAKESGVDTPTRADLAKIPLEDVLVSAEPGPTHSAGLEAVREAALELLSTLPHQALATFTADATTVGVGPLASCFLPLPSTASTVRLGDVAAQFEVLHGLHHVVAVVALVRDPLSGHAPSQGHRLLASRFHREHHGLGVRSGTAVQSHREDCTAVHVRRVRLGARDRVAMRRLAGVSGLLRGGQGAP